MKKSEGFALLYIKFSKTIQFGQKDLVIPLIRNNCRALGHIYHLDPFFTKLVLSLVLSHTGTPLDLLLTLHFTKAKLMRYVFGLYPIIW